MAVVLFIVALRLLNYYIRMNLNILCEGIVMDDDYDCRSKEVGWKSIEICLTLVYIQTLLCSNHEISGMRAIVSM